MPGNVPGSTYAFGCPTRESMLEWVEVIQNYGKELRAAFDYLKTATPLPQIIDQEMPRTFPGDLKEIVEPDEAEKWAQAWTKWATMYQKHNRAIECYRLGWKYYTPANKGYFDWYLDNAFNILVNNQEAVFQRWEKNFETDSIQKAYEQAMNKVPKSPGQFQQIIDFCNGKKKLVAVINQILRDNREFLGIVKAFEPKWTDYSAQLEAFIKYAADGKALAVQEASA
jgi:hypothetical protein